MSSKSLRILGFWVVFIGTLGLVSQTVDVYATFHPIFGDADQTVLSIILVGYFVGLLKLFSRGT